MKSPPPVPLQADIVSETELVFDDGRPVRAASGVAPFAGGWLVAQDDATEAAWWVGASIRSLRLLPPVDGVDRFSESAGTKHLKPDLEAAVAVRVDGKHAVLLLGSGSLPARMRGALVVGARDPVVTVSDLSPLYGAVATAMGVADADLNLEGACIVGSSLRWFQRGHGGRGVPSASVDVALSDVLAVLAGHRDPGTVAVAGVRCYDLGQVDGVGLAITDAVTAPGGRVLVSAAAEDTPDAVADGPVVATALAVIDDDGIAVCALPPDSSGGARKVEGLALVGSLPRAVELLGVVDQDDPEQPSHAIRMHVRLP